MNASTLAQGLVFAIAVLVFFAIFSTVLASLTLPPDRIPAMPRWFQSLSVIRRTRAARIYYAVAGTAFVALSLASPVITLVRWGTVDPSFQVGAVVAWPGIVIWLAVLFRTTRR